MFFIESMSSVFAAMPFGFAKIKREELSEGILPKRQGLGTGVTSSDLPVSTSESVPATSEAPPMSTSTSVPTTNTVVTSGEPSTSSITPFITSTGPSVTSSTSSISQSTSDRVNLGTTTIDRSSLTSATIVTTPLVVSRTERSTFTSIYTSNGASFTSLIATDRVVSSTTGFATSTITPSLAKDSGSSSGLSQSSKDIIGGVVGGVGGAILIGGLALVAWRLWGKKKQRRAALENDMWDPHQDMAQESKSEPEPTLPRYQNPGGSINTASNF